MSGTLAKGFFAVVVPFFALVGAAWAAPPGPAPTAGRGGPPAAWVAVGTKEQWLAYSGWCWNNRCVRPRNPATRSDLPKVRAKVGSTARIHFGFAARAISVSKIGAPSVKTLPPGRIVPWRVAQTGVYVITASAADKGTVSYALTIG